MQVHCRCGQEFDVHAERFPHQVRCHVCGLHFNVLDDGEVVEQSAAKPVALSASTDITASRPAQSSNAICTDEHAPAFASADIFKEELRLFELQWQNESARHTIATVIPTRCKGLIVGIGIGGTFLTMWAIEFAFIFRGFNPVVTIGTLVGLALGGWLYRRGLSYESARSQWQLRRVEVYLQYQNVPPGIDEFASLRQTLVKATPGILLFAGLLCGLAFLCLGYGYFGVGIRDLEITFVITDADSDAPIDGAKIDVSKSREHELCQDCDAPLHLVTNREGTAKRVCRNCFTDITSGGELFFRYGHHVGVYPPRWQFEVTADRFQKSGELQLYTAEFLRTQQRGDQFATMEVAIKLHRQ
jgi:hypothetical protein